jgi:hypothetical protein
VYDPATQRLHAWGGYEGPGVTFADPHRNVMGTPRDPVTPNPVPYTGFFYGADGGVLNCINISDRTYTTYRDLDIDDMLDPGESTTYTIFAKGEPRPLVNARWLDATIVFEPTGSARFLDWNAGRRAYRNAQVVIPNLPDPYTSTDPGKWPAERDSRPHGGVRDLCKHYESSRKIVSGCGTLKPACQKDFNDYPVSISDTAEVGHFHAHTNAWRISLAADADPAADTFPDAQQALDSMFPLWRVEVSQAGGVRVFEVRRDTSAFADIPRWPAAATTWQNPTEVHDNCILGFLHRKPTVAWRGSDAAKPELAGMFTESAIRGRPILDAIDTDMLVRQQWWLDP